MPPLAAPAPVLDHLVIDGRDRMDAAEATWRGLGFALTPRGYHSMGSANHLAVFDTDYLEVLGWEPARGLARPDLSDYPHGLNGLVFKSDAGPGVHDALRAAGVPVEAPVRFSRPVALPGGAQDARFEVTRLPTGSASIGRVYFCHHETPELVWRPEWRAHPNGAVAITRMVIAAADPATVAGLFGRMFGADTLTTEPGGAALLRAGAVLIEVLPRAAAAAGLGAALPDAAGRADFMALIGLRTSGRERTRAALAAGGVAGVVETPERLLVPASSALNVALAFEG